MNRLASFMSRSRGRGRGCIFWGARASERTDRWRRRRGPFSKFFGLAVAAHFAAPDAPARALQIARTAWSPRSIRRVVSDWRVPDPPRPVDWTRADVHAAATSAIAFDWTGDALRHAGTAVHAWLARIATEGLERWGAVEIRSAEAAIRAMLLNLGVAGGDLDAACDLVVKALLRTVNDERGRWILAPHVEAECEVALSGLSDRQIYDVVIDRTFVDEAGVRWIVDYKTGSHAGGSMETFLASEKRRYEEQLARYARLMAQRDGLPIRLGLYFPLLAEGWVEWEATAPARRQASLFAG